MSLKVQKSNAFFIYTLMLNSDLLTLLTMNVFFLFKILRNYNRTLLNFLRVTMYKCTMLVVLIKAKVFCLTRIMTLMTFWKSNLDWSKQNHIF